MSSSIKVVLRKKGNQDGTYPLALRITVNRKSTYLYLGQNLKESEWDAKAEKVKKSHPNSTRLNNLILKRKVEANDKMLELASQQRLISHQVARTHIRSKSGSSFFAQADIFIENLRKQGKYNRVNTDIPHINHFRDFLNDADISFQEISVGLLERYRAYLKSQRKVGERTIVNHLIIIRTIYNKAIAAGLVDYKYYPFGKGKINMKFPESVKIGLSANEVKVLEQLDVSTLRPNIRHARNLWLISFYFAGMRVSDVLRLKHSDFQNDRLYYTMSKNAKAGSLKLPAKAISILESYPKDNRHDLVFPDLNAVTDLNDRFDVQRQIRYAVMKLDRDLKVLARLTNINKSLSMHIARHTFGNLSGEKIPIQLLQKLYRHTSITTTIGYQSNFIHKDADDALDAVLDL